MHVDLYACTMSTCRQDWPIRWTALLLVHLVHMPRVHWWKMGEITCFKKSQQLFSWWFLHFYVQFLLLFLVDNCSTFLHKRALQYRELSVHHNYCCKASWYLKPYGAINIEITWQQRNTKTLLVLGQTLGFLFEIAVYKDMCLKPNLLHMSSSFSCPLPTWCS